MFTKNISFSEKTSQDTHGLHHKIPPEHQPEADVARSIWKKLRKDGESHGYIDLNVGR